MRFRIRGPSGQSIASLGDLATVNDLCSVISETTGLPRFTVKYGYPKLSSLDLDQLPSQQALQDLGVNLNGEVLVVAAREDPSEDHMSATTSLPPQSQGALPEPNFPGRLSAPSSRDPAPPVPSEGDPPEVPSPEYSGTFILRIMPDDNSCLFRAVGTALMGGMDAMTELRSVVAQTVQENQDIYSEAVLDKKPSDYCRWIQNPNSWGGAIELSILSKHFGVEICSIDVKTLRVDHFNEGVPTRCVLVYSGIHYDTIALSPSDPPFTHTDVPPEFDTKVFDAVDPVVLEKSLELCGILQSRHYYTDTSSFRIKCNTCGRTFVGERGATKHAAETGHFDFGESA